MLSIGQALELVPPEALRYLVMRERPQRTIAFDPGCRSRLVDEVDDQTASGTDSRALELSRAGGFTRDRRAVQHLVVAAQIAGFDPDRTAAVLARTGYTGLDRAALSSRLGYARRWLDLYAPEEIKFEVKAELPSKWPG